MWPKELIDKEEGRGKRHQEPRTKEFQKTKLKPDEEFFPSQCIYIYPMGFENVTD